VPILDRDGAQTGSKQITKIRFRFGYLLATEEATWYDPRSSRTLIILHTGPQTFNAAESYCQKAYLRALLKIPTGDQDLDQTPQADTTEDQVALMGGNGTKRKSSAEGKRDGSVKVFNTLRAAIQAADTVQALQAVRTGNAQTFNTMPRAWHDTLMEDFAAKMEELGGNFVPDEEVA
jgi:hypothetical protein